MSRRGRFTLPTTAALATPLALALLALSVSAETARVPARFPAKDELTIAVTDSGLGGLAIMAEAAVRARETRVARRIHFVFFNALFSNESGYNSLPTRDAKLRVFDRALRSLEATVRPDLIVVGCNTLSVLYPDTAFARTTRTPVVEIVGAGVGLFRRELQHYPDSHLLLFGTATTIDEGAHRRSLVAAGVPAGRMVGQACGELAAYIERDWRGDDTGLLVASFVGEAVARLPAPRPPVLAGLVCTHYGYVLDAWTAAFTEHGAPALAVLDPNRALVDVLFATTPAGRASETIVDARVVSMVEITPDKRRSLGAWLNRVSPEVAAALASYELRPDLFEWRSLVKP
jgi:glutamate racemase